MGEKPPVGPLRLDSSGIDRPAAAAVLLSVASGFVDAFVFVRVYAVFTANQSGNLVLAGIAVGQGRWLEALAPTLSLLGYVAGATAGVLLFDRGGEGGRRFVETVVAELAALAALATAMAATDVGRDGTGRTGPLVLTLVVAVAATMGLQSVALRSAGGVALLTTAGTGNVTSLGVSLARIRDPNTRRPAIAAAGVLAAVVTAYIGGAVLGAGTAHLSDAGPVLLVIPLLVVAATLALEAWPRAGAPAWRRR